MLFIFDMGGVVTTTFEMTKIYEKFHLTKDEFKEICRFGERDLLKDFEIGKINSLEFWNLFNINVGSIQRIQIAGISKVGDQLNYCSKTNLSSIPEIKTDYFHLFFNPVYFEDTVSLISSLKKHHRVVCGTNTNQSHYENHLERGDYSIFDKTYTSHRLGVMKPDPEFFKLILEGEGYEAKDTFFTDDKLENCEAAASLGINVFHCTKPSELKNAWIKYC